MSRSHPVDPPAARPGGRVSVSLRVGGDDVDPAEITRLLGAEPSFAARKGDPVQRGGRAMTQRSGIWIRQGEKGAWHGWALDDAIVTLLGGLTDDLEVWADLGRRFRIDLFCGLFMGALNEGVELRPSTLRLMGERGLTLGLDIYGHLAPDQAKGAGR